MSQKIPIKELKPHADNAFFFDDIAGDAWDEFVESVKTSGVIEPIVITQDKVIVSGHQRVRACKALGIDEIEAEVRIIDSEDEALKQLIETNIRQRGIGNTNPVKFGRCLKELDRIYGVFRGNHTDENQNNLGSKTQEQIASEIGISAETYRNYEKLAEAIPEIQTLIETGIVTPTAARAIMKKLPEFQQQELAKQFAKVDAKATQKAVDKAVAEMKAKLLSDKESAIAEIEDRVREREEEIAELRETIKRVKEANSSSGDKTTSREKFEKARADRLQADKEKLEKLIEELKSAKREEPAEHDDSEEIAALKQQMLANAKMELADFVNKYSDVCDVKALLSDCLKSI